MVVRCAGGGFGVFSVPPLSPEDWPKPEVGGDASAAIDGDAAAAAAAAAMRSAAERLSAACDAVGKIGGALAHVAEGAAVPEHQGVLSTTYSIEVVDW